MKPDVSKGILWFFLSSFNSSRSEVNGWLFSHGEVPGHALASIPKSYEHDRSRAKSGIRHWLDFLGQGLQLVRKVRCARQSVGVIAAFPQLTAVAALFKLVGLIPDVPVVAWYFNLNRPYAGLKGWAARLVMHQVDIFVVHSRAEMESYSRWLRLPLDRFVFVPLTAPLRPQSVQADSSAEEQRYVLAMGSANRDYGLFLKVVGDLGVRAVLVSGPHAVEGLVIPPNVELRSSLSLDECHRLAQMATVNVIPLKTSDSASGQVTLIETMLFGRPVVATICAGTVDYMSDGKDGLLVAAGDYAGLRDAILKVWNDPVLAQRLGGQAAERARSEFTPEAVLPALAQILEQAGNRRKIS